MTTRCFRAAPAARPRAENVGLLKADPADGPGDDQDNDVGLVLVSRSRYHRTRRSSNTSTPATHHKVMSGWSSGHPTEEGRLPAWIRVRRLDDRGGVQTSRSGTLARSRRPAAGTRDAQGARACPRSREATPGDLASRLVDECRHGVVADLWAPLVKQQGLGLYLRHRATYGRHRPGRRSRTGWAVSVPAPAVNLDLPTGQRGERHVGRSYYGSSL